MTKSAVLTTSKKHQNVLDLLLSKGIDPSLLGELEQEIQQQTKEQLQQKIQQDLQQKFANELRKEVKKEVQKEVNKLKKETNKFIKEYSAKLESTFDERVATEVAQKVQQILEQNALARHKQFGPKNESSRQLSLFNEAEEINEELGDADDTDTSDNQADTTAVAASKSKKTKARGRRKPLPPELPRVEVVVDIDESERKDADGKPLVRIGEEVSEKLDIIPMQIRVIRTIRPKYAPANGEGSPVIAPVPAEVLPRSNFSAGALAMLLTVKYADGLPLHRFNKVLSRHGVSVPRQSLARYVIESSKALQPLANLMQDALLETSIIHMDETSVQVLKEPGKKPSTKSYMWVRYGGPPDKKVVLFNYAPTRNGKIPIELLQGWAGGYLMTDDYAGYNEVAKQNGIKHLACMAHARRKFVDAKKVAAKGKTSHANYAIKLFARLYRIEKRVKNAPPQLRYRVRQKLSKEVLDKLNDWMLDLLPKITPKSKLGEALNYLSNVWPKLIRYIERGDLPIDNNICENAIRPFVVGRKAWLFSDTQAGANASALIYSLIETAKANGKEPYAWLCYVLERLPYAKTIDQAEALLPWNITDQDLAMNLLARQEWG